MPSYKSLNGFVLRQAKLVIYAGGLMIAFLGALPKFPFISAGEHRFVLLALMLEDRVALSGQFRRTQRNSHLDFFRFPFLPRAAIEPDLTFSCPRAIL